MSQKLSVVVAFVLLVGCSPGDDSFPGYASASGDLVPFLFDAALKYGARPATTSPLPKLAVEWRHKSDKDGIQIYVLGNRTAELIPVLVAAFGSPALQKTNAAGQIIAGVYAAPAIGAAVQYGMEDVPGKGPCTTISIVRQKALSR
jgi:hypothetical protein